ncbi:Hypp3018 [Branchiostoma lanceolatum]|uniref:Hypp3018 protein n=1 Tax=Branchiostoma lanceolatum TaxID=7740 RepID=A0A8J9ZVS4_BRALA|nr:Hypp3018 [Branchiostoma lanceolatum]
MSIFSPIDPLTNTCTQKRSPDSMASLPAGVLCAVVLFACSGDAAKLPRQFEGVNSGQCVQDGVAYPVGASVPDVDDNPCSFDCLCYSNGNIACNHWICFMETVPCVDAVPVNNPTEQQLCCNTKICPNGPNCRDYSSGQIIPAGQTVTVNGAQCRCPFHGLEAVCFRTTTTATTTTRLAK